MKQSVKTKKKFKFPSTITLLALIIIVVAILTYIVPAGQYNRELNEATGNTVVIPDSYHTINPSPVSYKTLLSTFYNAIIQASSLIAFVFVCGGAFGVITHTGAITAALNKMIEKLEGKEEWFIAIVMLVFCIGGASYGMAEETIPFVAIMVAIAIKMGYDPIVGVSMIIIGVYTGYSGGAINPFNTGIAQEICGLPIFSGMGLRIALSAGTLIIAIHHVSSYGKKYKKQILAGEIEPDFEDYVADPALTGEIRAMTKMDMIILCVLFLTIAVLIFGVIKYQWYFEEMAALFMTMGIVAGMIYYKGDFNSTMNTFMDGAKGMAGTVLVVAMSRGVLLMMQSGGIMDTFVYWLSIPLSNMSSVFAAWGMYISQGFINYLIPSSSGQATAVMPIFSSVADLIGITRQTAILAYQSGDGFWNMITPAHATTMACIGIGGISFSKWFKYAFPLILKWSVWVFIILAYAVFTGYGPF
jgi:uncharacterized ion transporter superfamily protein YfcC